MWYIVAAGWGGWSNWNRYSTSNKVSSLSHSFERGQHQAPCLVQIGFLDAILLYFSSETLNNQKGKF